MSVLSPLPRRSAARRHCLLVGGVALPAALVGSMLGASPASATVTTVTVSTKAALRSALATASNGTVVVLGTDLVGDGGADDVVTVPASRAVTLNLGSHKLDLDRLELASTSTLFVSTASGATASLSLGASASAPVDSNGSTGVQIATRGRLEVQGGVHLTAIGSSGRAGIGTVTGSDANAALYVDDGATIAATGGSHGAGIGGGEGAAPLSVVSIGDATVTATGGAGAAGIGGGYANPSGSAVEIAAAPTGTVTATGGAGGAGIGGGMADPSTGGGIGADVTIEDADVTVADGGLTAGATGTTAPSAIGGGQGAAASAFGTLTNTASGAAGTRDALRIRAGATLAVPAGRAITNAGDLLVSGVLTGSGSIDNTGGTIKKESGGTIADASLTVTGRNHAVTFDAAGGTATAPATVHAYATSLANAGLDLGAFTGTSGSRTLVGWTGPRYGGASTPTTVRATNAASLTDFSASGGETDPVQLTAVYEAPIAFTGVAMPNAATGQPYTRPAPVTGDATSFTVAGNPASGLPTGTIPTLPAGLTWSPTTGAISGTPSTAGHHSFVITASSAYQSVSQAVTIDVAGAPVIASTALPTATVGTAYSAPVVATSDSAITYRLTSGILPAGLQLDPVTGAITGTPTAAGTFTFGVEASNAYGPVGATLSIAVSSAAAPAPTSSAPPAAQAAPVVVQTVPGSGAGTPAPSVTASAAAPAPISDASVFAQTAGAAAVVTAGGAGPAAPASGGSVPAPTDSVPMPAPAVGTPTPTPTPTGGGPAASPPKSAATPVLPAITPMTVRLGHPLSVSVAASSTTAVAYSVPRRELPKGVALDPKRGLLYGAPLEPGRFVLHVSARNTAGSSTVAYVVVVPEATRLVTLSTASATPVAGTKLPVTIRGLAAGERWRIQVDGRTVQSAVTKRGGTVRRTVALPARTTDTKHVIRVSGDRTITDPSTVAAHRLTVTAVAAKKALTVTRSGSTLTVRGLAAAERVTVRRGFTVLAKGHADAAGVFTATVQGLQHGVHTATGATRHRVGKLTLR